MKALLIVVCFNLCFSSLFSQSQSELLKNFTAKELIPAAIVDKDKKEIKNKPWPISIEKQGDIVSKIILLRAGIIEEICVPDVPAKSSYFYTSDVRICFYNNVFHYYKSNQGSIILLYILAENKSVLEQYDVSKATQSLTDYFNQLKLEQKDAKANLIADLNTIKEKEKSENLIKGKVIKSLQIVWLTKESETGMQSMIQFGVKAIDDKGKVYSTDNLGGKTPWEDFVITSVGAIPGDEFLTVDTDASKIIDDKVTVTVKNKYDTKIASSSSIKISYVTPVNIACFGKTGCPPLTCCTGTRGFPGNDVIMNVCNSKDDLYVLAEIKVGEVVHKIKLKKGVALTIDATGGPGCSGRSESSGQGGKGGDGARGGDITIVKSATLNGDNLIIYNSAGKGGKGGKGKSFDGPNGANGSDGDQKIVIGNVNLNF
jgi:hypothetical protein